MQDKKNLRKHSKNIRKNVDVKNISKVIMQKIQNLDEYQESKTILIYSSVNNEIDTFLLLEDKKDFFLPVVNNDKKTLSLFSYHPQCPLILNDWQIPEPDISSSEQISPNEIDLAIIPALMADCRGYRLGYGGGFYDRLIPNFNSKCTKIIPIVHSLLIESLPTEEHDQQADIVISEQTILKIIS